MTQNFIFKPLEMCGSSYKWMLHTHYEHPHPHPPIHTHTCTDRRITWRAVAVRFEVAQWECLCCHNLSTCLKGRGEKVVCMCMCVCVCGSQRLSRLARSNTSVLEKHYMGQVDMVFSDFLIKFKAVFKSLWTVTKCFFVDIKKKTYFIFLYLLLASVCVLSKTLLF